jgi:glycosyltransferase involved in cell wall biosynthesis
MLGWEFPPHISGGLGTACHGLTQGLARAGVEVVFVVPRARGGEDARHLRLVGANQIPVEDAAASRPREHGRAALNGASGAERGDVVSAAQPVPHSAAPAVSATVRSIEVDSLLSPYLDARGYRERLLARARAEREAASASHREARRAPAATESRPRPAAPSWFEAASAPDVGRAGTRLLEFSGTYGDGLMEEVARYALAVEALSRRETFDVIHAHDWMSVPAGIAAQRASKKPLVFHVHACEHDRSGDRPDARVAGIEQLGLDQSDLVVAVSHYTAGILKAHYRVDDAKLRIVHNALTRREQREQVRAPRVLDEPLVLFLGRITAQKGPEYFLEAAARVVRLRPDVKFVIAGSGDRLGGMIELAARLGLARNTHFTGFLTGADVERMYAMADVYVMPSVSEPFGIAPLEAMALDVPVIVSRQSGVCEVLRSALKVDYWDVPGIAEKILAVLTYPDLSRMLQEEGKAEALALRWDAPAAKVRSAYDDLAKGAGTR